MGTPAAGVIRTAALPARSSAAAVPAQTAQAITNTIAPRSARAFSRIHLSIERERSLRSRPTIVGDAERYNRRKCPRVITTEVCEGKRSKARMNEGRGPESIRSNAELADDQERPALGGVSVVGIGASAGGLEAFRLLLGSLPPDTGFAIVLVQHLDPTHESSLSDILGRVTTMPVRRSEEHRVGKEWE